MSSPARELPVGEVWYVSYGSNLSRERLACYIEGGCPPGGARTYPGARDQTPPERSFPVDLPGTVYFAGSSSTWGGGVAFYDHDTPGPSAGRAYLVTAEQFADIAAQEMHRLPDPDDPLEEIVLGGLEVGRHEAGPGHYETLVQVGTREGRPMLTFTAPHGAGHVEHADPAPAYLAMLGAGLAESRDWDDDQVADYLDALVSASRGESGMSAEPASGASRR